MIFGKDSNATSWVAGANGSDFPIQNLPYGVVQPVRGEARIGAAIGDRVLDLARLDEAGLLRGTGCEGRGLFARDSMNAFMALGRQAWSGLRARLVALLTAEDVVDAGGATVQADRRLREDRELCEKALLSRNELELKLPCQIGNYVDFYSSKEHATNVGSMFRDPNNPLLPNWVHVPIGYHGRACSIVVSGTDVVRPCGQTKADDADAPTFGPTRLLDIELEMGFFVGPGNTLGTPIPIDEAHEHIFGMVLVNDWSARDIQRWEYVPLGPFLGKSFATSISPWVVSMEALAPFRVAGPRQDPTPLPYLRSRGDWALDIGLHVDLRGVGESEATRIASTNFSYMYWNVCQQLAHLTSNGSNVMPGDLCASGTVSGPTPDSFGSMLELCWKGTKPLTLKGGGQRKFLADGDEVIMSGVCQAAGFKIGFGEVAGRVLPSRA